MTKKNLKFYIFALGFFVAFWPVHIFGTTTSITLTYPFVTAGNSSPAQIVSQLYTYALGIAGTLAVMMIVYGGIKYIIGAGNTSAQGDAKDIITSAIWGIVLLAGAYLVLSTINPDIVNLNNSLMSASNNTSGNTGNTGTTGQSLITDQDYRNYLQKFGIQAKPPCGPDEIETQNPCVDLGNLRPDTVEEIRRLKEVCGVSCDVFVTGGSGAGHSTSGEYTHANGYKFDLRYSTNPNDPLTQYIEANDKAGQAQLPSELQSACQSYSCYYNYNKTSNTVMIYMLEGDHWDVTVIPQK